MAQKKYIKLFISILACLTIMKTSFAQDLPIDDRYKKYAGRYGDNSGVVLFEDGSYLMYGYATGVFGIYKFGKDRLLFYPDKLELFEVYACQNPDLRDSIRVNFVGFERGSKTFVQFDQDRMQRIFNENANCFGAPFVYQKNGKTTDFTLSSLSDETSIPMGADNTSWRYKNDTGYNDFMFIYYAPKREYEDFAALISPTPKGDVIRLSNYGGDRGYLKQDLNDADQREQQEILEWKKQYDVSKKAKQNQVYANKHYYIFPEPDASKYIYDAAANLYTDHNILDNAYNSEQNQYSDPRYLRKYIKLKPENKDKFTLNPNSLSAKSIFFTVCGEGSEHSYHYKGFKKEEHKQGGEKLQTTRPVKLKKIN